MVQGHSAIVQRAAAGVRASLHRDEAAGVCTGMLWRPLAGLHFCFDNWRPAGPSRHEGHRRTAQGALRVLR